MVTIRYQDHPVLTGDWPAPLTHSTERPTETWDHEAMARLLTELCPNGLTVDCPNQQARRRLTEAV